MNHSSLAVVGSAAPLIELKRASKTDGGQSNASSSDETKMLLDDISFTVFPGDRIGIFSPSAAESEALVNCLAGVTPLDRGELVHHAHISWPLGSNEALDTKLSGYANASFAAQIYETPQRAVEKINLIQELAELSDEQYHSSMVNYSPKMRQALKLAISLAFDFDCYLIGRIGDWKKKAGGRRIPVSAFRYLNEKLKDQSLVISSSNQLILALRYCTSGIALIDGRIVYRGEPDACLEIVREYRKVQVQKQIEALSKPDFDEGPTDTEDNPSDAIGL